MLQVYDRVLPSRSEPTLVLLLLLVVLLYGSMGLLDLIRGQVGARIGAALQSDLDGPVFRATLMPPPDAGKEAATGLYDLEAVRKFLSSPVAFAIFDLPFAPMFLGAIFLFHPSLGCWSANTPTIFPCIAKRRFTAVRVSFWIDQLLRTGWAVPLSNCAPSSTP
jgi:ATP-binding cassette subfamily C protein